MKFCVPLFDGFRILHHFWHTFTSVEYLLESLLPFHRHFGSSLAALFASRNRLERQSCHRRHQGANSRISPHSFGDHFGHIFLIFSRRAPLFSMSFRGDVLVMLSWCICVPFLKTFAPVSCSMWSVPEVIWTAQAWPKHMFWLLSAPRNYKKTKQKSVAIWSFILNGFWHHFGYMFSRK